MAVPFFIDQEIADEFFRTGCCRHCKSKELSRSDYPRDPRGIPKDASEEIINKYSCRFSFLCRKCRRRTTPPSVRFMGRKIYATLGVLWVSLENERGALPGLEELRQLMGKCLSDVTIERWLNWWQSKVWNSPFWKEFQGQLLGEIKQSQFISGVWDHFKRQLSDSTSICDAVLRFFSPITKPEVYPF